MLMKKLAAITLPSLARFTTLSRFNQFLLKTLNDPQRIYGHQAPIPTYRLTFVPAASITVEDMTLCERLIIAFQWATVTVLVNSAETSALWPIIILRRNGEKVQGIQ